MKIGLFTVVVWFPVVAFWLVATYWAVVSPDPAESATSARRKVLATAVGALRSEGEPLKIIKYQTSQGVWLEVFGPSNDGLRPLLDQIHLSDPFDAFFDLMGEATRLAILDLDGDGRLEVIAPTLDSRLSAHLNAYRWDDSAKRLTPIQP